MKKCFKTGLLGTLGVITALSIAACGVTDVPVAGLTEAAVTETEAETEKEPEESKTEETEKDTNEGSKTQGEEDAEDSKNDLDSIKESKTGEKTDKDSDNPIVRAIAEGEKKSYTMDDVVGNWKYDKYDNMYLSLYDNGKYEIHDIESGDVTSDGSFKLEGNTLELSETGKDPQKITISSNVRLVDDEGDLLTPYIPESELQNDTSGDKTTRSYGKNSGDDLTYTYHDKDGKWQMKSASRGCYLKYTPEFYADYGGDFLYVYDGDEGYVTARNVTDVYYDYAGSDEDFVYEYSYASLLDDFEYFYGDADDVDNMTLKLYPTDKHFSETYVNLMNYDHDIQCASTIFHSEFKDGTDCLIMINKFYRFGDNESKENVKPVTAGGYRKN
ncbi:hypothetical protein [Oribacterium sp. P6A1]|uniref:hypothetical protein n=1 Tax=Oribacterium sp. P6A1 TaxID=1410612 RepID=UPI00055CC50A|nr:hypothetical protein [Oribacterium sp. P6A1]